MNPLLEHFLPLNLFIFHHELNSVIMSSVWKCSSPGWMGL